MTNSIPTSAFLAGALVLLAPFAGAQSPAPGPDELKQHGMSVAELGRLLDGRDREVLHPGQPLIIVGNEEGDNEFRHGTPLLEGAIAARGTLDLEEARTRRLAMYDASTRFTAPLRRSIPGSADFSSPTRRTNADPTPQPTPGDSAPAPDSPGVSVWLWIAGSLSVAVLAWRKRHMFTHLS